MTTSTTEFYTLSLHDALPIWIKLMRLIDYVIFINIPYTKETKQLIVYYYVVINCRSEEHTSELQSRGHLVCRLLLEKKNLSQVENIFDRTKHTRSCHSQHELS